MLQQYQPTTTTPKQDTVTFAEQKPSEEAIREELVIRFLSACRAPRQT